MFTPKPMDNNASFDTGSKSLGRNRSEKASKANLCNQKTTRRSFVNGFISTTGLILAGCSITNRTVKQANVVPLKRKTAVMYAALPNEQFPIPAVDLSKIPEKYYRKRVDYTSSEKPGTVIVDTNNFYLYLIEPNQKAMRYGVGLGRAGFEWSGRARIAWKQEWPKWTPPDEMIARQPELEKYSARNGGKPPGIDNPLGSRALYIFQGNQDTLYRIHGSPEYWTIGKAVSSGCVRMVNQDVIDLYDRVKGNPQIVVL
jgi:lipoprotein-anchoring transpeptidase ErfK/SrfK